MRGKASFSTMDVSGGGIVDKGITLNTGGSFENGVGVEEKGKQWDAFKDFMKVYWKRAKTAGKRAKNYAKRHKVAAGAGAGALVGGGYLAGMGKDRRSKLAKRVKPWR